MSEARARRGVFFTHACVASVARSLARHGVPRLPRRAARRGATRPARPRPLDRERWQLGPKELARPSARCVGRRYGSCRGRGDAKLTAGRAWWVVRAEKALSRRRGRVGAAPIGGANRVRLSVRRAGRRAMVPRGERAAQLTARRPGGHARPLQRLRVYAIKLSIEAVKRHSCPSDKTA